MPSCYLTLPLHLFTLAITSSSFLRVCFCFVIFTVLSKSLQSFPTLCDPIDGSPPGSPVPGILQARILEWVAISFSNAWKWNVKVKSLSRVRRFATPWTAASQAPPSMWFSKQEYWSGVPLPSMYYSLDHPELCFRIISTPERLYSSKTSDF